MGFERSSDTVIAVMGMTGVGKSTFINYFADKPVPIGHTLEACKPDQLMSNQSSHSRFENATLFNN
jgi:putative ribosome biogenesis GTPase RsgA